MSAQRVLLRGAARLLPGTSRAFAFERNGQHIPAFLLKHQAGLFAYVNRCPHWAVDLDLGDERFYAEDIDRIYCKNHGALFRVADGVCDYGPCLGRALERLSLTIDGEDVWVELP